MKARDLCIGDLVFMSDYKDDESMGIVTATVACKNHSQCHRFAMKRPACRHIIVTVAGLFTYVNAPPPSEWFCGSDNVLPVKKVVKTGAKSE